jgi:hypothetical protein
MNPSVLTLSATTIEQLLVQLNLHSLEGFRAARVANVTPNDAGMLTIRMRRTSRGATARVRYTADRYINAGVPNFRINTLIGECAA